MHEIVEEISKGLKIDHNNVIKVRRRWQPQGCASCCLSS